MKVLFDFEIDESIPREASNFVYEKVREFFKSKFQPLDKKIERYLEKGEVALVVISMHGSTLKTIPYNIPSHLIDELNGCVTPEEFNTFQDKLIETNESNLK